MSGYLQRLVRNAMTPARSIHPAVGSIFSPPKDERMAAPLMEFEDIETVGSRPESDVPASASPRRAVHVPASPAREGETGREDDEPRPEVFRPIAPIPQRIASPVSTSRKTAPALAEPGPLGITKTEQLPEIHAESGEPYTPLLPPIAHTADAEVEIFRPSQTIVSAALKKETFGVPRRAVASEHEPDEIQIHIGRIEVTAVPQTAPRPAVVPASKSINLDEYLKRGRGRA
jgi:hypothetical protein